MARQLESQDSNICNVWVYNFEEELKKLSELLDEYPIVAMDTEFPGVVIDEVPMMPHSKDVSTRFEILISFYSNNTESI